jgi:hypothetical protein
MNEILDREPIVQSLTHILTNYEANCANLQFNLVIQGQLVLLELHDQLVVLRKQIPLA